jgi:uncharacterized protein (TIGR00369 family)
MASDLPPTTDDVIQFIRAQHAHTVLGALDIQFEKFDAQETIVTTTVSERLFQHGGIVHGGIYVLLAESAASTAAALAVDVTKVRVAGQEISAAHVRASTGGVLRAIARPLHRGRTSHVYDIRVENDGRLVCACRCTVALRPIAG